MTSYEKAVSPSTGVECVIKTDKDGRRFVIPADPANSDYQRYLRWLENPDADEFNDEDYA